MSQIHSTKSRSNAKPKSTRIWWCLAGIGGLEKVAVAALLISGSYEFNIWSIDATAASLPPNETARDIAESSPVPSPAELSEPQREPTELAATSVFQEEHATLEAAESPQLLAEVQPVEVVVEASAQFESATSLAPPFEDVEHVARIDTQSEKDLLLDLERQAITLGIDGVPDGREQMTSMIASIAKQRKSQGTDPEKSDRTFIRSLLAARSDFAGLPFQMGDECQLNSKDAVALETSAVPLKGNRARFERVRLSLEIMEPRVSDPESEETYERLKKNAEITNQMLLTHVRKQLGPMSDEKVRAVCQVLDASPVMIRDLQLQLLSEVEGPEASKAIARRALFDLDAEIRAKAHSVLRERPENEYRDVLLAGFDYPWAPVAQHAAEAVVAIELSGAAEVLSQKLNDPDPTQPYRDEHGDWHVRELVRLNHLRNCAVCHAPAFLDSGVQFAKGSLQGPTPGKVLGVMPSPSAALPSTYYSSRRVSPSELVRADVTYLRQDFSVEMNVPGKHPWPREQRFDFLVRNRKLTKSQIALVSTNPPPAESKHREAVIFALKKLTNKNLGPVSTDWVDRVKTASNTPRLAEAS